MRYVKNWISAILIIVLCLTPNLSVIAEEGTEAPVVYDKLRPDDNPDITDDTAVISAEQAAEVTGADEIQKALEYIYVDETVIHIPQTQYIAVAFSDTELIVESAILYYESLYTGETHTVEASNIIDNSLLFTVDYPEGSAEDDIRLTGMEYTYLGGLDVVSVDFAELEIEAGYAVTNTAEAQAADGLSEMSEVTVYSMDEDGNMISEGSDAAGMESIIESVLEVVDPEVVSDAASDLTAFASTAASNEVPSHKVPSPNKIIYIVAGHCPTHYGARGNGLKEEELTFKVAQYIKQELERYSGVTVYQDRPSLACAYPGKDTNYCVSQRVRDAAAKGASVVVDVHFNAGGGTGAEVYYPNNSYSNAIHQDGKKLADQILSQLSALGLTNRGAKIRNTTSDVKDPQGNLADYYTTNGLAKELGMTGIIVENAFLDRAEDAAKLKDESFLQQLGVATARGIANTYGLAGPSVGAPKVEIVNKDDYAGTAQIKLTGMGSGARAAIWSDDDWQDDIKWFDITGSSGTISFDIKEFKNTKGTYYVHVYNSAMIEIVANTTFTVSRDTSSKLIVSSVNNEQKVYNIQLQFADMPSEITKIQIPVWCAANQSDIKWYNATQTAKGIWTISVNVSDHKLAGEYKVHAYATNASGVQRIVSTTTFAVQAPSIQSYTVSNYDQSQGTFDVVVKGVNSPSGVSKLQIPVWSTSNQSDIIWYNATKQSDGSYIVHVDIANHKYNTGIYQIHLYLTAGNGLMLGQAGLIQNVVMPSAIITANDKDGKETSYELKAGNLAMLGSLRGVSFAVWSEANGQDDLIWYSGSQNSNGAWISTADIKNHKTPGRYNVHVYATAQNGSQKFIGATTFTVTANSMQSIVVKNYNQNAGTFDVVISGITAKSEVSKVQVPIWSASDQNDIKWYDAARQSDGSYIAQMSIANHKFNTGIYQIHAYLTSANGVVAGRAGLTQNVLMPSVTISADDRDGKEITYDLKAGNVGMLGSFKNVNFAVWSETGGQDDLIWYSGSQNSNGAWISAADIKKHKTAGRYNVHVYATLQNGSQKFIGATTFTVTANNVESIVVKNYNQNAGTFDVVVSGITAKSGVDKIQVPIWSTSNQSDIKWYDAVLQNDGSYKAQMSIVNHQYHTGIYQIHMYLTSANGVVAGRAGFTQNVLMPSVTISADDRDGKETFYDLKAGNVGMLGSFKNVNFAVWSETGGQDDLIWYSGSQNANGTWAVTADIKRHKTAGRYNVHVYAVLPDNTQKFIGATVFQVSSIGKGVTVVPVDYNETTGTFAVRIANLNAPSGISQVQVPVWSSSNQNDIKWYTASRQSDGSYRVQVDPMNHYYNSGIYQAHVYVTANNGITALAGATSQTVKTTSLYTIMGETTTNVDQMVRYYNARSPIPYPSAALSKGGAPDIRTFAQMYIEEAAKEGVRAEVAFAQAMNETGFLKYGGIVLINQFNFGGIGALDGNSTGQAASFPDVRTGIRAQIHHLKAYGSTAPLNYPPSASPRFNLVQRGCAPYVQWLGINENPYGKGWATAKNYGYNIVNLYINVLKSS